MITKEKEVWKSRYEKLRQQALALTKTDPAPLIETDPPNEKSFFLSGEECSGEGGSVLLSAKAERNGKWRGARKANFRCIHRRVSALQRKMRAFRRINESGIFLHMSLRSGGSISMSRGGSILMSGNGSPMTFLAGELSPSNLRNRASQSGIPIGRLNRASQSIPGRARNRLRGPSGQPDDVSGGWAVPFELTQSGVPIGRPNRATQLGASQSGIPIDPRPCPKSIGRPEWAARDGFMPAPLLELLAAGSATE